MSSFLYDFIGQLEEKWDEVDILINKAKEVRESNEKLYNAICRSITILIVAHFEGFIKDLVKNIIRDLNSEVDFRDLPIPIKRTYCKKYLGNNLENENKSYNDKINKLINKFEELDCDITDEPFYFPVNKNPNPNVIINVFENFGLKNVFSYLYKSDLENVFSETGQEIKQRITNLRNDLKPCIENYPYNFDVNKYCLSKKPCHEKQTLWQEFIDDINQKRHNVVHGNIFENGDDVMSLEVNKDKVILIELGLTCLLSHNLTKNY